MQTEPSLYAKLTGIISKVTNNYWKEGLLLSIRQFGQSDSLTLNIVYSENWAGGTLVLVVKNKNFIEPHLTSYGFLFSGKEQAL